MVPEEIPNNLTGAPRAPEPAAPVPPAVHEPKKLVLFFDGTGNKFTGSNADTNVVKLLNKLDRNDPSQYHYYQTGIGTYDINEKSVNKSWLGEMRSNISQTLDQAIGTTFDAHVMAGYRFLMRYYDTGDKIYMFGFSRGAFTAKFLARMIHTVGLLCKGNEEMVPFAFRLYQRYLAGEIEDFKTEQAKTRAESAHRPPQPERDAEPSPAVPAGQGGEADRPPQAAPKKRRNPGRRFRMARDEITAFSNTFCRKEEVIRNGKVVEANIKVYFLGMWDCVNSVSVMERETPVPVPVKGTAHYVRHAVAIDERRVKFKPALLAQDMRCQTHAHEDIKEVWFPGCHGDVGGGWPAMADNALDSNNFEGMTHHERTKNFWKTRKAKQASANAGTDPFQMSDIPLAWMIRELELVGKKDPAAAVRWCNSAKGFKKRLRNRKEQALRGFIHDGLQYSSGTGFFTVSLWKIMEWWPFITRWELEKNEWVNVRFPLNGGAARDIPRDAVLHESVIWRLNNDEKYKPKNNHGGRLRPCLKDKGTVSKVYPVAEDEEKDADHQTYILATIN